MLYFMFIMLLINKYNKYLTMNSDLFMNAANNDNARPHVALATQAKLKGVKWEVLPHTPYSPDMSSCDYYLFLSLSNFLCNKQFNSEKDVKMRFTSSFAQGTPNSFSVECIYL